MFCFSSVSLSVSLCLCLSLVAECLRVLILEWDCQIFNLLGAAWPWASHLIPLCLPVSVSSSEKSHPNSGSLKSGHQNRLRCVDKWEKELSAQCWESLCKAIGVPQGKECLSEGSCIGQKWPGSGPPIHQAQALVGSSPGTTWLWCEPWSRSEDAAAGGGQFIVSPWQVLKKGDLSSAWRLKTGIMISSL